MNSVSDTKPGLYLPLGKLQLFIKSKKKEGKKQIKRSNKVGIK
jgi:hypothetical protein